MGGEIWNQDIVFCTVLGSFICESRREFGSWKKKNSQKENQYCLEAEFIGSESIVNACPQSEGLEA